MVLLMPGCSSCPSNTATMSGSSDPLFQRVLWIALVANLSMFLVEVDVRHCDNSMSLQADAPYFLGNATNYGTSLFVAGMALTTRAQGSLVKGVTMAASVCLSQMKSGTEAVLRLKVDHPPVENT